MHSKLTIDELLEAHAVAFVRLERHVAALARAKGIEVSVEVDLERATAVHHIKLRNGHGALVIPVDQSMFIHTDYLFDVLVLPQISAAISKLAASSGGPTP